MRQVERINEIIYALKGYKKMLLIDAFININDSYYNNSLYQDKKLIKRQNKNNNKLVNTKRK